MEHRAAPYLARTVFHCDLILFIPNIDVACYADDNAPFARASSELEVTSIQSGVVDSQIDPNSIQKNI